MTKNPQWRLIARPQGEAGREHFAVTEGACPEPRAGEVLVRNLFLFVPPSMRLWMDERDSYFPAQKLGEVMMGITLGIVERSNVPELPPGTYVNGMGGWQHWFTAPAAQLQPVKPHAGIPLEAYRTVLDVQGLTAHYGLTEVGKPKPGETLVVTAAAGSVGSLVCQIGKRLGLKVIGIAGGDEKCRWLVEECGIDAAIDYRGEDVGARLDALAPEGIDILYENVGGPVMDLVLDRIRDRARIVLCGLVSSYNGDGVQSTRSLMQIVNRAARMEGFLVRDCYDRYAETIAQLEAWVLDGSLKYQIDVLDGLDSVIEAMSRVFHGRNRGVQLVRLTPP